MLHRSNAWPLSRIAALWRPVLGSLLAALGAACVVAGAEDIIAEVMRPPGVAAQFLSEERPDYRGDLPAAGNLDDEACWGTVARRGGSCSAIAATDQPLAADPTNRSPQAPALSERSGADADCWGKEIDRATRSESAHLSTLPLCPDPRHALVRMAATQHHGRGFRSRHTDFGDGEASLLVDPTLTQQPVLPRADTHISPPHNPPEGWEWQVSPRLIIATTVHFSHRTWSESSGYESVEAIRAAASQSGLIAGRWRQQTGELQASVEQSRLVRPWPEFGGLPPMGSRAS